VCADKADRFVCENDHRRQCPGALSGAAREVILEQKTIEKLLSAFSVNPGYLLKTGWLKSMQTGEAVDAEGNPIPWITYPAIDFLAGRVQSWMSVFEYGSGNSTLWWSSRVSTLVSCEHDKEFYADFRGKVAANTTYLLRRAKGGSREYDQEIIKYRDMFDIIVIDGRHRVECAINCLAALQTDGVIVWDNSDREEYRPGFDFLFKAGFKCLDFRGMGALATRRWNTSIFYRPQNCLGI